MTIDAFNYKTDSQSTRNKEGVEYTSLALVGITICSLGVFSLIANVDIILLLMLVITYLWLWRHRSYILAKYFYVLFISLWSVVDVFALENQGLYLPNLRVYSYHAGSLFLLVLAHYVFVCGLVYFESRRKKSHAYALKAEEDARKKYDTVILLAAFILLAIFIGDGIRSGYYHSGATSRYEYALSGASFSFRYYLVLQLLIPVIAIVANRIHQRGWFYWFVLGFVLYLILTGNKFGAILLAVNIATLSAIAYSNKNETSFKATISRFIAVFLIGLIALASLSFLQMYFEKGSYDAAIVKFEDRVLGGQGDVWWGVYSRFADDGTHIDELVDELQPFSMEAESQLQYNFAIYKMMNLIAPPAVLENYALHSVRFTASTDASLFYYFGPFGLLLGRVILSWMLVVVTNALIFSCSRRRLFEVVFIGFLFTYALRVLSMSEFYLLLSPNAVICYIALASAALIRRGLNGDKSDGAFGLAVPVKSYQRGSGSNITLGKRAGHHGKTIHNPIDGLLGGESTC